MSSSVNKVTLVGNVGQEPDIKTFTNGGKVANLSIATSESWKDKATGERKERVQWHRVVIMNEGLVNVCERYIKKGDKLYLEGKLETRKYTDKNGSDAYVTEVVLRPYAGELVMLSGKRDGGTQQSTHKGFDAQGDIEQHSSLNSVLGDDSEIPF